MDGWGRVRWKGWRDGVRVGGRAAASWANAVHNSFGDVVCFGNNARVMQMYCSKQNAQHIGVCTFKHSFSIGYSLCHTCRDPLQSLLTLAIACWVFQANKSDSDECNGSQCNTVWSAVWWFSAISRFWLTGFASNALTYYALRAARVMIVKLLAIHTTR